MKTASFASSPYIIEDEHVKSLQFSAWGVQSRMRKEAPNELALGYTQAMMAFLLLQPAPKDILIVGLGGGSLSKYCYHQLPTTRVTTVEVNSDVISLRNEFCIPEDDSRFQVIHDDAAQYLRNQIGIADVILLDGYDNFGIPTALSSIIFYRYCLRALRDDGIMAANISSNAGSTSACSNRIHTVFEGKVLKARSKTGYNAIVFGLKNPELPDLSSLRGRATTLWQETGIDYPRFLDQMLSSAETWRSTNPTLMPPREEEQA